MSHPDAERVTANEATTQAIVAHHALLSTGLVQRVEVLLDLVENDHLRSAEAARHELRSYLRREILPHARAEEGVLYPPAAATVAGRLLVESMIDEHRALGALERELAGAGSPVRAAAAARALAALFGVHVYKENNLVLPLLVSTPGVALADLLAGMHDLLGDAAGEGAPAERSGGCGGGHCACDGDGPATSAPAAAPVLSVDARLDVRDVPHDQRHALVLSAVEALPPGEALVLVAPHAPRPVLAEVDKRFGDLVAQRWLQSGPEVWQVRLERVRA